MRQRRQHLGHRARRRLGLQPLRRAARQGAGAGARRQPALGQVGLAHPVHVRHPFALCACAPRSARASSRSCARAPALPARPARASAPAAAERASGRRSQRSIPSRCALIIQDMQNDVVMDGGAFASSGSPQHAREQNVVENIRRLADACRVARRDDHPRLVRRRAGRARLHAQRAAVRGPGRLQGDGARHLGRGAGRRASSRSPATTSWRRCA